MRNVLLALVTVLTFSMPVSAQFTPGNLVAFQVGDGAAALTSAATPVFLRQYTISGTFVNSTSIPSAGTNRLTVSGTATSEGGITRSLNGTQLVLPGYDADAGTASIATSTSSTVPRIVNAVDFSGTVTSLGSTTNFSTGNIRGAFSNGSNTWAVGSNTGVSLVPGTTVVSSTITNLRVVNSFNGNLYFTTGSGTAHGLYQVGTGLPTTPGTAATLVIDTGGSASSPYGFAINPAGTVAYVADDRSIASGGGVQKWTLSGGTWSLAGTFTPTGTGGVRGLVVDFSGANPVIFATTTETSANRIVSVVDTSVFSAPMIDLATAPTNTALRGITFSPVAEPTTVFGLAAGGVGFVRVIRRRGRTGSVLAAGPRL